MISFALVDLARNDSRHKRAKSQSLNFNPLPSSSKVGQAQVSQILIFCTSLQSVEDVRKIAPVLDAFPGISSWSVDLEDCDKVLRLLCALMPANSIVQAIAKTGFNIREMTD